jgi:hypothetical protein
VDREGAAVTVQIYLTTSPPGKVADAEIHFNEGVMDGLKLIGFSVWKRKGGDYHVTFPSRQYSVSGERRSFALLRPILTAESQDRLKAIILEAYYSADAYFNSEPSPTTPPTR